MCFVTNDKHILEDSLCYLIGSMEFSEDNGVSWRKTLINKSIECGLKIKFLNPTDKISCLAQETGEEREKIISLKSCNEYDKLSGLLKRIVRQDLRCVDLSDFVIFYIDIKNHTCGSYDEFYTALDEKKPYYVICRQGKNKIPAWLFGRADHNNFFSSIDDVIFDLNLINKGEKLLSDKWVLFRKEIEEM
jgi:hypothetical protein